ncbi:MAG: hypothetical protein EOO04_39320, partial [Chitinophagaceae bacterium]
MICFRPFLALLLAAWIIPISAAGQNLVFNGSFDEPNLCTEYEAKCAPSAWFYVYATGPGWGYKPRENSSDYVLQLFSARKKDETRSFWQTMLATPVVPGQEYKLELDISGDKAGPNLNDVGIVVTRKMYFAIYSPYKLPETYISLKDAQVSKLNNGWYHLSKTCTFADTMQVLVVGNFSPKSNLQILEERKNKEGYIVTTIDNLSLVPVAPAQQNVTTVPPRQLKDSLYNVRD